MATKTITFERDGKTWTAVVDEPVEPLPDALIVEYAGKHYSIAIALGGAAYIARPIETR